MSTMAEPAKDDTQAKKALSAGARQERRLGWLLCAPAVIVMLAVTAYPICYAIYLSLQRYDLRFPNRAEFIGLSNYGAVLSSPFWWDAFWVTIFLTVVSVAIELVLGMGLALVMHRTLFARGTVRTAVLIPYGIVTVVAAFSWQYAWTPELGYLAGLLPSGDAPLTEQWPALWLIILAEVWKTTPFMALLLLAGLALVPEETLRAAMVDGALAAVHQGDAASDETGDPRRPALPHLGRLPHLRQHLRPHRGRPRHRIAVHPRLRQPVHRAEPGHRVGDLGPDLHLRRDHRLHLRQAVRRRSTGRGGEALMAAAGRSHATRWGVVNVVVVLYALFPVWWIVALSFKAPSTLTDGSYIPTDWTWENYKGIFQTSEFTRALINSIGIALIATAIAVVLGTMAAYAVARLRFPGKQVLIGMSLLIAMFPPISLVSPLFNIERSIGIFDTWPGLIIPYMTFSLPLAIYTLSAFFREIPWDLEKAAKVDGATPAQAFRLVIVPLAAPGVFTTAILVFIFCWNDFLFAISLTSTESARTVPAAIAFFTGSSQFQQPTGSIAAAAVVITVPIIIFVLLFQRRIVAGLTSGAVKG